MECVDLVSLIEQYDLALMDTSFLDGDDENRNLLKEIYATKTSTDLEEIGEELNASYMHWTWMEKNILPMKGVATVLDVIKELKQLKTHLKASCRYFMRTHKTSFSDRKVPKKRAELDFDQSYTKLPNSQPKSTIGLNALRQFTLQVGKTIKTLKEHYFINSVDGNIPTKKENISLTDYALIDAGVDYLRQNPEAKVGIFTRDYHHILILDDYLNQNIALPKGELAVYRFYSGKVHNGCLLLREGLVSEGAPVEKYPEAMEKKESTAKLSACV